MSHPFVLILEELNKKKQFEIHSFPSNSFPINDAEVVDEKIAVNILGLLGPNSPYPNYLLNSKNAQWVKLINSLNQRFYQLFFNSWLQCHPVFGYSNNELFKKIISTLIISKEKDFLSYAQYLFKKNYSVENLGLLIKALLPGAIVELKTNTPVWLPVSSNLSQPKLADQAILGDHYLNRNNKITIYITLKNWQQYKELIQKKSIYELLCSLIHKITFPTIIVDLIFQSFLTQKAMVCLGIESINLQGLYVLGSVNRKKIGYRSMEAY